MISNHQRTVLKLLWKKKSVCANQEKKHWRNPTNSYKFLFKILLPNMSIIHINLLVILSTHVCASMFKNSHFIKQKWSRHNFSILPIYGKISCLLPLLLYEKKITTTKKERNMKMVVEIVVTGLRKRKKRPTLYINLKSFSLTLLKKKQPLTSPQACTRDQKKLKETYKKK